MEILESFEDGLFEVFLETDTEYGSFYKTIIVKCNRIREEDSRIWKFCIYRNYEFYAIIGKFLKDLAGEIRYMDLADGIEGVYKFLDSLIETEYSPGGIIEYYYQVGDIMLRKRENQPVRLYKNTSKRNSIDDMLIYYSPYLIFLIFILVCIIFATLKVMFARGNDSAVVYNWGLK